MYSIHTKRSEAKNDPKKKFVTHFFKYASIFFLAPAFLFYIFKKVIMNLAFCKVHILPMYQNKKVI